MIDTSSAACTVALFDGRTVLGDSTLDIGRGHAEALLPIIAALPDGGQADAILVGCGPGSFTGIRVGVAAGRALGLGWGVPVYGFSSLALIAARGFAEKPSVPDLGVAVHGGHGEWFIAAYRRAPFAEVIAPISLPPELAADDLTPEDVVGDAAAALVALRGFGTATATVIAVRYAVELPEAARAAAPTPHYARGADARPMP